MKAIASAILTLALFGAAHFCDYLRVNQAIGIDVGQATIGAHISCFLAIICMFVTAFYIVTEKN